MEKSEFWKKVFLAGNDIQRQYNATGTDRMTFNWNTQSVVAAKAFGIFYPDPAQPEESLNPVAGAVRKAARLGSFEHLDSEALIKLEEAWEYFSKAQAGRGGIVEVP